MLRYEKRFWALAALLASLAGYVDAIGFIKLGGLFVSFMSGNSTRLAVGSVSGSPAALVALYLILAFVLGVMLGSAVARIALSRRKPAVLALVTLILAAAGLFDQHADIRWSALLMACAMGAMNAVFQRDGEVSIGVSYMTGTLVKLGQNITAALAGGPRWGWVPYLLLWLSLVSGAALGAFLRSFMEYGPIWFAAGGALLVTGYAVMIGGAHTHSARL